MSDAIGIVTVGDTQRQIVVTVVDENNNVVPLSTTLGNHKLQGRSNDTPAVTIDYAPTAVDGPNGVLTFATVGGLVSQANLTAAAKKSATYRLKVRFTTASGSLVGFTDKFFYTFDEDPLQLP